MKIEIPISNKTSKSLIEYLLIRTSQIDALRNYNQERANSVTFVASRSN
jgi:hypothetical protein